LDDNLGEDSLECDAFLKTGCRSRGPCSEREHNERLELFDSGQTSDVARFGPKVGKTKLNKIYANA